jgi:tetratricopeptide (TPR) repeat protein
MHHPTDAPERCEHCKTQVATTKDTHDGRTEMLCAICFDQQTARVALEKLLVQIVTLETEERFDEALAILDCIWRDNQHRDHDHWLARNIAMHRSDILLHAERYADAKQACDDWATHGFTDLSNRWLHAVLTARALEGLGRLGEGIAVLEESLEYQDPKFLPSALMVLTTLAEISEVLGRPVDRKWQNLADDVAKVHGATLPVRDSLGKSIRDFTEMLGNMQHTPDGNQEPT